MANLPVRTGGACSLRPGTSDVNLFRYREGIIDLYTQMPGGALDLRVSEQELHGS
jgi:hypothetical protein